MTDQLDTLRRELAGRYRIERELGQGGMAVVYLATDLRHQRQVALKVLRPELAGALGPERFLREIATAAALHHPHLVPLYDSGQADGQLFYVMPYITGQTLRDLIVHDKQLPVELALRITRELADAAGYAHRHGVVHRDIKPENVFLEENHAFLADFGIAKAVTEAAPGGMDLRALSTTGAGTAIGTPTYMSPEQAAGARDLDGRSDQYSLACVLHEMLAGQAPFTGPTPETVITQHMVAQPPDISGIRPAASGPIAAALRRALSKAPADRFPTMEEFAAALPVTSGEISMTRGGARPGRRGWRAVVAATVVVAVVAVAGLRLLGGRSRSVLDVNRIAVIPFEVLDPSLALWREGAADYLSQVLDGAGPVSTVPRNVVIKRWRGAADPASVAEFARANGAGLGVFGSFLAAGPDSTRVLATVLDAGSGKPLGQVELRGDRERMDHLLDSLAVTVLREIGKSRPVGAVRKSHLGSSSMTALKLYLQGEQYFRRGAYDSAIPLYHQAVAVDSGFALAWWHLGEANAWLGGREKASAFRRAAALNHGLSSRDSLLIAADSGRIEYEDGARAWSEDAVLFGRVMRLQDEAIERFPDDPEARYKRADLMFHFSNAARVSLREIQLALAQAVALDSGLAEPFEHLVQLTLRLDGPEAGLPLLAAFQRWFPGRTRPFDLARRLLSPAEVEAPSTQALIDSMTAGELPDLFYLLGAFPDSQEGAVRAIRAIRPSPGDPVPIVRTDEGVRRLLRNGLQNRGHLRQAAAAAPHPIDPMRLAITGVLSHDSADALMAGWADSDNYWKRLYRLQWLALAGDSITLESELPVLERWALKEAREHGPEWYRGRKLERDAYLAPARRDTSLALKLFHEITDTLCVQCVFERDILVRLHAGRGEVDQAWRLASTRGQTANPFYFLPFDALALLDHAALAERLGKRDEAIEDYRYLVGMWRNADPELQKYVTQAREGLARLSAEPR